MATSPIYNWPEPDNTDLVKNGALAIRTMGNAIDTTMATMTPKSIVDAKGDLIAATANDTPARLAVGANTYVVMADSTAPTGLKYGGDWTTWTPTLSNLTIGNGTVTARYRQIGKTIECFVKIALGTTSVMGTGPSFSLPFNVQTNGPSGTGSYDRFGVGGSPLGYLLSASNQCYIFSLNASGTYVAWNTVTAALPFVWAANDAIFFQFSYEAA